MMILFSGIFCFEEKAKTQESSSLRILYQGVLRDLEGNLASDGKYNMAFSIYDGEEGGKVLWEEEHSFYDSVLIKNGQFKIILGRKNPKELNFNQPSYWLALKTGEIGQDNLISWGQEIKPRKKIISLSQILKEEGLELLEEDGLDEEEWKAIFELLERKMEIQPDLIILMDLKGALNNFDSLEQGGSKMADILKIFINFISEKISQIFEQLSLVREKVEGLSMKLEGITSILADMNFKINILYQVLIQDKGLAPSESFQSESFKNEKTEKLIFKSGESSLRVFNRLVETNSLIFVSFAEDPGSSFWISEKIPGYSFTLSLKSPAEKDLIFDYWILNEEESGDSFQNQENQNTESQEKPIQESGEKTIQNPAEEQALLVPDVPALRESTTSEETETDDLQTEEEPAEELPAEKEQSGILPADETGAENEEQ